MEPRKEPSQRELDQLLEAVKTTAFLTDNAAFLGSLSCTVRFRWDRGDFSDTVGVTPTEFLWGVGNFLRCSKRERDATFIHELWHLGLLHHLRRGNRDPRWWNYACDIRINNDMRKERDHRGNPRWFIPDTWVFDESVDKGPHGVLSEEEIYDLIVQGKLTVPVTYRPDLVDDPSTGQKSLTPQQIQDQIAMVVQAVQSAEMTKEAGKLPGSLRKVLKDFFQPQIPWQQELMKWMTELSDEDYSWSRRNRRYPDAYMPSLLADEGRLDDLAFFFDVSGSVSDRMVQRVASEVKYIQEVLQPNKLTLIQFDTEIQKVQEYLLGDRFDQIEVVGRGGTCYRPVHRWIQEHRPTAAVIFTDLECTPMEQLTTPTAVLWAVVNNPRGQVPFGRKIHITEEE